MALRGRCERRGRLVGEPAVCGRTRSKQARSLSLHWCPFMHDMREMRRAPVSRGHEVRDTGDGGTALHAGCAGCVGSWTFSACTKCGIVALRVILPMPDVRDTGDGGVAPHAGSVGDVGSWTFPACLERGIVALRAIWGCARRVGLPMRPGTRSKSCQSSHHKAFRKMESRDAAELHGARIFHCFEETNAQRSDWAFWASHAMASIWI